MSMSNLKRNEMANKITLKVGDQVMWRGGFGGDAPLKAKVTGIELCKAGEKYGESVDQVFWKNKDRIVVDLDNDHWARGHQISPI